MRKTKTPGKLRDKFRLKSWIRTLKKVKFETTKDRKMFKNALKLKNDLANLEQFGDRKNCSVIWRIGQATKFMQKARKLAE